MNLSPELQNEVIEIDGSNTLDHGKVLFAARQLCQNLERPVRVNFKVRVLPGPFTAIVEHTISWNPETRLPENSLVRVLLPVGLNLVKS